MSAERQTRSTGEKFRGRAPGAAPRPDTPAVPTVDEAATEARQARTARTKPIRGTYDLPPARYRAFGRWLDDAADELGVAKVDRQTTIDTLVHLLVTDETVSRRTLAEIRRTL